MSYLNDELNLIIEFDGYRNYSEAKIILFDENRDKIYTKMGYRVVRIPYFIQLSNEAMEKLFSLKIRWKQDYPYGFG